ncbi:MAG: type II toxin-antitoxin system YoeB family toxin [Ectothiorhodospira sp.]
MGLQGVEGIVRLDEGIGEHVQSQVAVGSRRIKLEHRLVYEVNETSIRLLACRFHYR